MFKYQRSDQNAKLAYFSAFIVKNSHNTRVLLTVIGSPSSYNNKAHFEKCEESVIKPKQWVISPLLKMLQNSSVSCADKAVSS